MRITDVKGNRHRVKQNVLLWEKAIKEAERKLSMAVERTTRLQEIVADLKAMRDSGEIWPT